MKKALLIMASFLGGVFIFLSLVDKSNYVIERQLWHVQKKFDRIALDSKTVPDAEFEEVAESYRKIMKRFPHSQITPRVPLQIGKVYTLKKDYKKAREILYEMVKQNSSNSNLSAEALADIAWIYELENNWSEALNIYEGIIEKYPLSNVGINTPIYIAEYYQKNNNPSQAKAAFNKAITFYKKVSRENPNSLYDFTALRLLASALFSTEEWQQGIEVLGKVLNNYPDPEYLSPERANLLLKSINMIDRKSVV